MRALRLILAAALVLACAGIAAASPDGTGSGFGNQTVNGGFLPNASGTPVALPSPVAHGVYQYNATNGQYVSLPVFASRPVWIAPEMLTGTLPTNSLVGVFTCPDAVNFPADFTSATLPDGNSRVSCATNPSGTDTFIIKAAGAEIGSVKLNSSCLPTWCTGANCPSVDALIGETCAAGQRLEIWTSGSPTSTGIGMTLWGHSP